MIQVVQTLAPQQSAKRKPFEVGNHKDPVCIMCHMNDFLTTPAMSSPEKPSANVWSG